MSDVAAFYDDLAPDYDAMFHDWDEWMARGAANLDAILRAHGVQPGARLLDATCGIGTQALPLARLGYQVTASDLSAGAVERARAEAARRGLALTFAVADLRVLQSAVGNGFDVVLACDNGLAHFADAADVAAGVGALAACAREGGLVVVSVRDYEPLVRERPRHDSPRVSGLPPARSVALQLWEWEADGRAYRMDHLVLRESGDGWSASVQTTRLRAVLRPEIEDSFVAAGLTDGRWHDPPAYHQPVYAGRRPQSRE